MHEISLTGATLLAEQEMTSLRGATSAGSGSSGGLDGHYDHQHGPACEHDHHHHHHGTLNSHSSHGHSHGHSHSAAAPTAVPHNRIFQVPVQDLVQESEEKLHAALINLVRIGPFPVFVQVLEAWCAKQQQQLRETSNTAGTAPAHVQEALNQLVQKLDPAGFTLLHWAAKRTDNVHFVKVLTGAEAFGPPPYPFRMHLDATQPSQDAAAMTPIHWACTMPHGLAIIRALLDSTKPSPSATQKDNSSSKSNYTAALECKDGSGCTPLLLAAQHGQVETVAYLLQRGADLNAVDENKDTATHWAAYKGSLTVLGLLSFYHNSNNGHQQHFSAAAGNPLQRPDAYGQTPLHLAALRGHTSTCRYIVQQLQRQRHQQSGHYSNNNISNNNRAVLEVLRMADKNGRTPYQLAVHKNKGGPAAFLKEAFENRTAQANRTFAERLKAAIRFTIDNFFSVHAWKAWLGMGDLEDLDESPRFPFHYVLALFVANFLYYITVFMPLTNPSKGVLWDYTMTHVFSFMLMCGGAYTLWKTSHTDPGRIDHASEAEIAHWRALYEKTLEAYADEEDANEEGDEEARLLRQSQLPHLCHTCHIARPARSKHDRFTGTCILQFDHHCPFVGTSIGLWNYKWFLLFLICLTAYFAIFWFMMILYMIRVDHVHLWTVLSGFFLGAHILFAGGMCVYHVQLSAANLTTNEHVNLGKYTYFWESGSHSSTSSGTAAAAAGIQRPPPRRFRNPWNKGVMHNFLDRFVPSHASYLLPEGEQAMLLSPQQQRQGDLIV